MKKTLFTLTILATLFSSALADSFGVRLGFPLGVQYTVDNNFGKDRDLRIAGGILPVGSYLTSGLLANFDVDYIVNRPIGNSRDVEFYYGGGGNLGFISSGGASVFYPGVHGLLGLEFHLDKSISIFLDSSLGINYYLGNLYGYGVNGGIAPGVGGALGMKFKL